MARAYFHRGQSLTLDGTPFVISRELENDQWQLEDPRTGRLTIHTKYDLLAKLEHGQLQFVVAHDLQFKSGQPVAMRSDDMFDGLSDEEREVARIRYHYANAVVRAYLPAFTEQTMVPVIKAAAEQLGGVKRAPHWQTVLRWYKRFANYGNDIRALVTNRRAMGNRTRRVDDKLIELARLAIEQVYLSRERGTIHDTLQRTITLVAGENKLRPAGLQLPLPTRRIVKRLIGEIPAQDRVRIREGEQAARRKFRAVRGHVYTERPLERVEIDHTKLDLMVVDEGTLLPLGRPTLTVCIDHFSRCILGFYLGFEPPSWVAVAQCLRHAVLSKTYVRATHSKVKSDWPCHGVMDSLVVDNGLEFHSTSLDALAFSLGIDIHYSPRRTPWHKGTIERLIGTMNRAIAHGKPGTTFASILEKDDYDVANNATITLAALREIIHIWICDYYHQSVHRTLGRTPASVWAEHVDPRQLAVPTDRRELEIISGNITERMITHKGVELHSMLYNSKELQRIRHLHGDIFKTTVRFNADNLGRVFIADPKTREWIEIPSLDPDYASGLSLWQHDVCKRYAREKLSRTDIEALAQAKKTISDIVAKEMFNKRIQSRAKGKRFIGDTSANAPPTTPAADSQKPASAPPENSAAAASTEAASTEPPRSKPKILPVLTQEVKP